MGAEKIPEKEGRSYAASETPPLEPSIDGSPATREQDTLHRGLKSRQISMIAIGGAVGTGLIIGSGTALRRGGPVGMLLGYSIMGLICYTVMTALGEMAAHNPHRKGFSGYASRYVDPALGVATGYNYLFKYLIVTANNVVAASIVLQYWPRGAAVPLAAWLIVFIFAIGIINLCGIKFFGEIEFWLSLIKVITLIGLIIMSFCLTLGANPQHERIGFRYWVDPGPFSSYLVGGTTGRFLGVWSVFTNALFAYMGTELIGVTVGECADPRRNIPSAIKKTFWRILVFYVGGVFCISLIIASNDQGLFVASRAATSAAASPFVVAVRNFGIRALPSILNAAILIFVLSAANSDLYIASRTLYALAEENHTIYAPFLLRVNKYGSPYVCLFITWLFCFLSFLRVSASGATVFGYFVNLVTLFGALTWMSIAYCHIRFVAAFKAQGLNRKEILTYRAPFGVIGSWIALIATGIVTFFKGFDSFIPRFTLSTFMTNYIGFVAFVGIYAYYKIFHKTRLIPLVEVDLFTGKEEIDADQRFWEEKRAARGPLPWYKRMFESFV